MTAIAGWWGEARERGGGGERDFYWSHLRKMLLKCKREQADRPIKAAEVRRDAIASIGVVLQSYIYVHTA